ncbi:MAG: DUF4465 domain-containing protein [Lepagella sp.]
MKSIFKLFILVLLMACGMLPASGAWSETDGVYYLKTSDGLEDVYTVDGTITFKSQSGATIPGYRDCGVVFAPANEGEVICVTVVSNDLTSGNYLLVYDGTITKIGHGTSDGGEQSTYLPSGWVRKWTSENVGESYTSTDSQGRISMAFHSGSANSQTGFTVTVSSIALKDMEYTGASLLSVDAPWRGKRNATLADLDVVADGGLNPLTLNNVTFDISALTAAGITDIALYAGKVDTGSLLASASGDNITISDVALKSGHNHYLIAGNLPADLTGTLPMVSVTDLTVDDSTRTVDDNTTPVDIASEIRLNTTHLTYTIGEPVDFYDDGGKDGNISENFTGMVTFLPSVEGQSVKVDVTKLDLFNTSTVGKNDILTFYNGRTDDADNLITTLLTDTKVVKSMAEDGSITVKLVSTTGIPKGGFEAVVSQFLPGNMTLDAISASTPNADKNISARQKSVELIDFDVRTDNTAEPLAVKSVKLTSDAPELIEAIRIYYLGESNTLTSAATLFGSASDISAEMTVAGDVSLIEGHNNFAIVADVAPTALNEQTLSLTLSSVKVADNDIAIEEGKALRTIHNIWSSLPGSTTVSIADNWDFLPTYNPSVTYAKRYNIGNEDEITTFLPTESGAVAQLEFESFVCNPSAKFEIYSGSTIDAANMIWEMNSGNASVGPARVIRSTAIDGALTIVFNPNTQYSYMCSEGWVATVRPFINHDMTIEGVTATRPTSAALSAGGSNESLLDFSIETEGTLTTKVLKTLTFDVEGYKALSALRVYVANTDSRDNAILYGESTELDAKTSVTGEVSLAEGSTYFWVEGDVREDAVVDTEVRVGVASVTDATGVEESVEGGNPEGSRTVKYIIIQEAGEHLITISQPMTWYDDGGVDGKISSRISSTYVFQPKEDGYAITLDASEFSIGNGKMYVYSGRVADQDHLLGNVTGYSTTTGPSGLVSTADDGSMTVVITGPSGSTLDGFVMTVGLHQKVDYSLTEATVAGMGNNRVMRGMSDAPLASVALSIEGDKGDNTLSAMKFDLTGTTSSADLRTLHLYYMDDVETYSEALAVKLGDVVPDASGEISFPGITLKRNGLHYFVLTADVNAEAVAGDMIAVRLSGLTYNDADVEILPEDVISHEIKAGLKGEFVIGAEGDYATFSAAVDALKEGVEGPVTFLITDGEYSENIVIEEIPGASEASPITFKSQSGDRNAVQLLGNYSTSSEAIFTVSATPWVTLQDVSIIAGSNAFKAGVYIKSRSPHFTLRNCVVSGDMSTSYSGIYLIRNYVPENIAGYNNDFMTIEDCSVSGGRYGMYLGGTSYVALPKERGLVVRNNVVSNMGRSLYIYSEKDAVITGNVVTHTAAPSSYSAFEICRLTGDCEISGNKIKTTAANSAYGLYLRDGCYGNADAPIRIFNNDIIIDGATDIYSRTLQINNDIRNVEICYNTCRIEGTSGLVMATTGSAKPLNVKVHDNLMTNHCTTTNHCLYFWNTTDCDGYTWERNALGTLGENVVKNDATFLSMAEASALWGNETNFLMMPEYASESDSHLISAEGLTIGTPCEFMTVDIEGRERPESEWTLGAYEFAEISQEAPIMAEGYPAVSAITDLSATISSKWSETGKQYMLLMKWNDDSVAPESDAIQSQTPVDISANVECAIRVNDLEESTTYRPFFMAVSSIGTWSEIVAGEPFTTKETIYPLEIEEEDLTEIPVIEAGEEIELSALVIGGIEPYTYTWIAQDGTIVSSETSVMVTPEVSQRYLLKVTSADGQEISTYRHIEVRGEHVVADFDDNYLAEGAALFPGEESGKFYSGSYAFNYGSMPEYNYWYGYALSNDPSSEFASLSDQYRSAPGGGFDSDNFCVAYPSGLTIDVVNSEDGEVVKGAYITNSAYAFNSMSYGDVYAQAFSKGSWMMVTIIGEHADGTTSSLDYYLGDYRDSSSLEHYIVDRWEWVDLRPLGRVTSLRFIFDGSDKSSGYLNTPTYLCLDRLGDLPVMDSYEISLGDAGYDLADLMGDEFDLSDARISYSLSALDDETATGHFRLDGSMLYFEEETTEENSTDLTSETEEVPVYHLMAICSQRGHSKQVELLIKHDVEDGISIATEEAADEAIYDLQGIRVTRPLDGEIYIRGGKKFIYHKR